MRKKLFLIIFLLFFIFNKAIFCDDFNNIISSLSLPEGFSISIYCYGLISPWMMAFDKEENLLVTIPKRGVVVALPDKNLDGKADKVVNVLLNLNFPSGIDIFNNSLLVISTTDIIKAEYDADNFGASKEEKIYQDLPYSFNVHWSRCLKKDTGNKFFISMGAPCNVCKPENNFFGSILQLDTEGKDKKVFAYGFHFPTAIAFNQKNKSFWNLDIGRKEKDNIPDELNLVMENKFYGWPYCYGDNMPDPIFDNPSFCYSAVKPEIKFPQNSSPTGLTFYNGDLFPKDYQGDLFIALHGEIDNKQTLKNGFKIVRVVFDKNKPIKVKDFITGWISKTGEVLGRPLDVIINKKGEMFITDDYAGLIYKVTYNKKKD